MKVAIVHDSLTAFGGAEQVLLELLSIFPKADLYTSIASPDLLKKVKKKVFYSKLSDFTFVRKYPSFFKSYFYHFYWNSLNLENYDLVISSSHSFCANWIKVKNTHVSYVHTPPRFLYEGINDQAWMKNKFWSRLLKPYLAYLRKIDLKKVKKVDLLIANSKNVSKRIKNYYELKSEVIYPPISSFENDVKTKKKENYYLFFSRLVEQKGISLALKAFENMDRKLKVVGTSKNIESLKKKSSDNVEFLDFQSGQNLKRIVSGAKALIYPALDEDLGMAPIEVLSAGVPVIAHYSGGPRETLNKDVAVFFKNYDEKSLQKAIEKFEKQKFSKIACKKQAKKFINRSFKDEFLKAIEAYVS